MRQPAFIVATLTGSLLFGASVAGALRAPAVAVSGDLARTGGHASVSAESASQRAQSAMLVAAIKAQFPGHTVEVTLEKTPTLSDSTPEQQEVRASARVRIDGSAPIPVRATALYDGEARSIAAPALRFEGSGERPADDTVRGELAATATRRLEAEFAGQPVALSLADAEAATVGGRYLRLVARGTADFGAEGRAATTVEALYDPRSGEWLRLDYTLGADPAQSDAGIAYAGP